MSMNLVFETKSHHIIDFPFQTPTNLTYSVLALKTNEERLKLLQEHIEKCGWDSDIKVQVMEEIKSLMASPELKLSYI
jgi:hypothetical protein